MCCHEEEGQGRLIPTAPRQVGIDLEQAQEMFSPKDKKKIRVAELTDDQWVEDSHYFFTVSAFSNSNE